MLVTDLKRIDDKRFCLYLDYEAFGPLYASDIKRLKLTVGEDADAEKLTRFRMEYFFRRAMDKAIVAIKYSEKCEYDIRYASVYVRSHINHKSKREITYALSAKKISDEWIEAAFEENQLPDEHEIVMRLIQKKCPASELKDRRDKVIAYLLRKGYPYRLVASCMDDILKDETAVI